MPAVTSTTVAVEQMVRRNNGRHEGGYRCVGRRCDPCARPSAVSGQEPPDRSEVSCSAWTAAIVGDTRLFSVPVTRRSLRFRRRQSKRCTRHSVASASLASQYEVAAPPSSYRDQNVRAHAMSRNERCVTQGVRPRRATSLDDCLVDRLDVRYTRFFSYDRMGRYARAGDH